MMYDEYGMTENDYIKLALENLKQLGLDISELEKKYVYEIQTSDKDSQ